MCSQLVDISATASPTKAPCLSSRWLALQRAKQLDAVLVDHSRRAAVPADGDAKGTVGCVARDVDGNLAGGSHAT